MLAFEPNINVSGGLKFAFTGCAAIVTLACVASLGFLTTLIFFRWRYQRTRSFHVVFAINTVIWSAIGVVTGVIPIMWAMAWYATVWVFGAIG